MRTLLAALACLWIGALPAAVPSAPGTAVTTFRNPILSGFHPDPSICRAGEDYYLTNSTFEYFPGLPIYHSRDLVHWELIGNALDRPSQLPLKGATDFGGLYAPTIRYWKGSFYLTCTDMNGHGIFIVTAKDPAGPWSEPVWWNRWDMDGSMLFDDDGKAYYTKYAGDDGGKDAGEHAGISQAEFDPQTLQPTTPFRMIHNNPAEPWNEGPHLYKIKGRYYLMQAEGGTGDRHQEAIYRSDSPWGPFEACPHNPILTHRDRPGHPIQCTGHADLVEAHDGSWWAVFLGVRPRQGVSVLGRETFLAPVQWDQDGWPIVNGDHHVELELPAPKLKPRPYAAPPARDEFKAATLGPAWIHPRNPDPDASSLTERPGFLRLRARPDGLNRPDGVPNFAGQRQPDFSFRARTRLDFKPDLDGVEAGLCVRANDGNHYEVGLERAGGRTQVFVRNTVKGQGYTVATAPFDGGRLQLELGGDDEHYSFAWSPDGKDWRGLGSSPSVDLSKDRAGGFTGAVVGVYATANGQASAARADFDWFELKAGEAPAPQALLPRPTPTPEPPAAQWRIRAGGDAYTDSHGTAWLSDRAFNGGQTAASSGVKAPADAELYQTERWGQEFVYELPVLPGRYRLTLKFAESYVKKPGQRVFSVVANGKPLLQHFDILKAAGGPGIAVDRVFNGLQPEHGVIHLRFFGETQAAKVDAIALEAMP